MHISRALCPLLLTLLAFDAQASGYYYSDSGIVATGRGGAFIAGADNQFAQYHNPAGLARMKAPTINIGWSGVQQKVSFQRTDANGNPSLEACPSGEFDCTQPVKEVNNTAPPFNVPQFGFATPFDIGDHHFGFAFGFISPFAPSADYPAGGAQRYSIIETSIYQGGFGPSLAWQPNEKLILGLGFQWSFLDVSESLRLSVNNIDDGTGDIEVGAAARDSFTPTFNAGVIVEPVKKVSIGLSVTPPATYRARGDLNVKFTEDNALNNLVVPQQECADPTDIEACPRTFADKDIGLIITLPLVLRGGVAVRPVDNLEIELAAVWQQMSSIGKCPKGEKPTDPNSDSCGLIVEDIDLEIGTVLDPENPTPVDRKLSLPAFLEDSISLRLGAEYDEGTYAVRLGGFYEQSAILPERVSVTLYDTDKVQLGGGGTLRTLDERLSFDFAFAYLFFQDLQVRDSLVEMTTIDPGVPLPSLAAPTPVVGNGNYASSGYILGIQTSWAFKKAQDQHEHEWD